ncbi:MAG: hypothetical protein WKF87_13955 [Chryseolinea sp.]
MQSQAHLIQTETHIDTRMEELYLTSFPIVARFVSKLNGTMEDAKDIFQDALIIYLERSHRHDLLDVDFPQKYILGIAKHLWMRKFKDSRRYIRFDNFESSLIIPLDFYPAVKTEKLLAFLQTTGEKCLDLLRDFYYQQCTMKQIVVKYNYGSERSATVQKFKCLEKIRETVKLKYHTYEDFFE